MALTMNEHRFDAETAIVVGASRGIGRAIAEELVGRGASVCLTARARDAVELEDAATALRASGGSVLSISGSSDDPEHRETVVKATMDAYGSVNMLVVAAGTNPQHGPLIDSDINAVSKVLQVNVVAALGWAQCAWTHWMRQNGGRILNISSINALRQVRNIGAYNVSKAAMSHLTRQLALELAPNVRVNALAPGVVKTQFSRALYEGREAEVSAVYPLGRLGEPADVAAAAAFLLSSQADWITGETLVIDGGVTLVAPE